MKNIKIISVLILIVFASLVLAANQVAVVTKVTGTANLKKVNKPKTGMVTLKPGMVLDDGDRIKTEANGFVAVVFIDDKTTVKVKENTELEITGKRQAASIAKKINMEKGTLRAQVTKQAKGEFVIQSSTSVASVKGTDFWFISDPVLGDQLIGLSGMVTFTNLASGMSVDVTGGVTSTSQSDGTMNTNTTDPGTVPTDPDDETGGSQTQELKIQFIGPDNTVKTLIIEYQ